MDANQLTFISDNIAKLKNLEVLIYTSNQLTSVTEKIG
jgi:Leucine-rich repeat (LRR) protein